MLISLLYGRGRIFQRTYICRKKKFIIINNSVSCLTFRLYPIRFSKRKVLLPQRIIWQWQCRSLRESRGKWCSDGGSKSRLEQAERLCIARATNIESIVWINIHPLVDCSICLFGPTQFQLAHGQAHACEARSWKLMHVRRRWLAVMTHKIIRVVIWPDTCMHMQNSVPTFFCSVLYSFPSCSFFTFLFPMLSQIFLL